MRRIEALESKSGDQLLALGELAKIVAVYEQQPLRVTSQELQQVAGLIYERMQSEPQKWRGPQGFTPSIEAIAAALPAVSLEISTGPKEKGGQLLTASGKLGEPLKIELPPQAMQIRYGKQLFYQERPLGSRLKLKQVDQDAKQRKPK